MNKDDIKVGDRVLFGRNNGEKTLAEVVKVNTKTVKVKSLELRGTQKTYPIGTEWKVPYGLITETGTGTETETPMRKPCLLDRTLSVLEEVAAGNLDGESFVEFHNRARQVTRKAIAEINRWKNSEAV